MVRMKLDEDEVPMIPIHLRSDPAFKMAFGQNLKRRMVAKNISQADLARKANGLGSDGTPKGRDAVSSYIRGKTFPEDQALLRYAKALGCKVVDLLPDLATSAEGSNVLRITQSQSDPEKVVLHIVREVPFATAAQIMELLK